MTRAVIYDRTSVRDDESMDEHLRRCRAFAESRGWDVVGEQTDRGISGYHDHVRPGWVEVKRQVAAREVDVVLFYALSRIERNVVRTFQFVELCEAHGASFASATEPIDTSGPWGRPIIALLAALAEMESATKRERALGGRASNARLGHWSGGRRPFGFRAWTVDGGKVLRVDEEEAGHLRRAATDVLNGVSVGSICRDWNREGVLTTEGSRWTTTRLKRVLSNPNLVPRILVASDQRRVTEFFDGRRTGRAPERYMLTGLLECGLCGRRMGGRGGRYLCRTEGDSGDRVHLTVQAQRVEDLVVQTVERHPFSPVAVEAHDPSEPLVQRREALEAEMEALGESDLPEAVLRGRARRLQRDLDAVDADLSRLRPAERFDFRELYEAAERFDPRRWVEAHVARIVVNPARRPGAGFDPRRVRITLRAPAGLPY